MLSPDQRTRLQDNGFILIESVCSDSSLLQLATDLGRAVPCKPGMSFISELRPKEVSAQRTQTFSSAYGLGSFPFHTDTAHWPLPARFVILRDSGETHDRPTLLLPSERLFDKCDSEVLAGSTWKVRGLFGVFLSSIIDFRKDIRITRYDPMCMRAANDAANHVSERLSGTAWNPVRIDWRSNLVVVIDNWRMLHGRGPSRIDDSRSRCLQRVLIFDRKQLPLFSYVLAT
jgi:Taurine catabolism dioxygenase TauD, TfdA family